MNPYGLDKTLPLLATLAKSLGPPSLTDDDSVSLWAKLVSVGLPSELAKFAERAEEHLFWHGPPRIDPLPLIGSTVADIIAAAGLPLVECDQVFQAEHLPTYHCHPPLPFNVVETLDGQSSVVWLLTSEGLIKKKEWNEKGHLAPRLSTYKLSDDGSLWRTSLNVYHLSINDDTEVCLRLSTDTSELSIDDAMGVMAGLLRAYDPLRFSLTKQTRPMIDEPLTFARRFRKLNREMEALTHALPYCGRQLSAARMRRYSDIVSAPARLQRRAIRGCLNHECG